MIKILSSQRSKNVMTDYGYFRHREARISIAGISDQAPMQVTFLKGKEALSTVYRFHLGLQTQQLILNSADIFGKFVVLTLIAKTETTEYKTYKTGYISSIRTLKNPYHATHTYYYYYEIELIPKFALLQHHHDCRLFQNKNSLDIIAAIFEEHGFSSSSDYTTSNVKNVLATTTLPLCVQYQESDFQFIERIMAHVGMFYYFQHNESNQKLIIADNQQSIESCKMESPPYLINGQSSDGTVLAGFYNWFFHYALPETSVYCNSYDPVDPTKYLFAQSKGNQSNIAKSYLSTHPHFGEFVPNTQLKTSDLNQQKATGLLNQQKYMTQHIKTESTLSTVEVGHSFSTKNSNFKAYLGTDCTDNYMIYEIYYDIQLIAPATDLTAVQQKFNNVHTWCFTVLAAPTTQPIPFVNPLTIPPAPLIGVIHHAFIVDKEGSPRTEGVNAIVDEFGMPYVGLHWDQTVRDQPNAQKYLPINTVFLRTAGFFDVPHPGETVKVQFSNWYSLPYILGVTGDIKQYKFPITDPKTQTKLLSRPITDELKNVNQLLLEDKPNQQNFFLDAPCLFNIQAAKDNNNPKFTLSVDKQGNLIIEAASINIKSTSGDIALNSAANFTLVAGKTITLNAGTSITINANTSLEQQANTSMNIKANANLNIKSATATIDGGGLLTLKAGLIKEN